LITFRKIRTDNRNLMQLQDNIASVVETLRTCPFLDGTAVSAIVLKSGANVINHLLDRQPQGYFLTDINASATVYRSAWDVKTITLVASTNTTVSFWVY
jgi:hypothetical protein